MLAEQVAVLGPLPKDLLDKSHPSITKKCMLRDDRGQRIFTVREGTVSPSITNYYFPTSDTKTTPCAFHPTHQLLLQSATSALVPRT